MEMPFTRRANPPEADQDCGPFTENLRRVLRTELFRDPCTAATVASEVRFEVACELLARTDMLLAEVAASLHYCDHSAFTTPSAAGRTDPIGVAQPSPACRVIMALVAWTASPTSKAGASSTKSAVP
jgi:hypothetical protein